MQKFRVTIGNFADGQGYMQHRMDDTILEEWEKTHSKVVTCSGINQPDEMRALFHAYVDDDGNFYMPAEHIKGALIGASTQTKSKVGARTKSMKSTVAGQFRVMTPRMPLPKFPSIDKRSVVNRNNKGRVISIRPLWPTWEVTFQLWVANDTLTSQIVRKIIEDAGSDVGIGSYSPRCSGEFGRFEVRAFEKISDGNGHVEPAAKERATTRVR